MRSYFWAVFSCIRTECRKIRTRHTFVSGHFSRSAIIIVSALPLDRGETEFFKKVPKREGLELGIFQFTGTGDRKKRTYFLHFQMIISQWINILCDGQCREEVSVNYTVVTDFKMKTFPLFISFIPKLHVLYLWKSSKSLFV